jgi:hypothetical protein
MKIECLREYLSAKMPAIRAPSNAPSSSTAADRRDVVGEASLRNIQLTHQALLPRTNWPLGPEILHNEYIGDYALIISEC